MKGISVESMTNNQLEVFVRTVLKGRKIDMHQGCLSNEILINDFRGYGVFDNVCMVSLSTWKGGIGAFMVKGYESSKVYYKELNGEGTVYIFCTIILEANNIKQGFRAIELW